MADRVRALSVSARLRETVLRNWSEGYERLTRGRRPSLEPPAARGSEPPVGSPEER